MSAPSETESRSTSDECYDLSRSAHKRLATTSSGRQNEFVSIERKSVDLGYIGGKNLSSFVKTSSQHAESGFVSSTLAQSISYRRKLTKKGSTQYELWRVRIPSDSRITQKGQVFRSTVPRLSGSREVGHLVQVLGREVGRIGHRPEVRYEGRIDVSDGVPVDTVEEGVSLDLVDVQTSICVTQESVRRRCQHTGSSCTNAPGTTYPRIIPSASRLR